MEEIEIIEHVKGRLEKKSSKNYNPINISSEAFLIYNEMNFRNTEKLDRFLLTLMAMDMGPEFELTYKEFCDLLNEL